MLRCNRINCLSADRGEARTSGNGKALPETAIIRPILEPLRPEIALFMPLTRRKCSMRNSFMFKAALFATAVMGGTALTTATVQAAILSQDRAMKVAAAGDVREDKIEVKADAVEDRTAARTDAVEDKAERKADVREDKAERKADAAEDRADRKADKAEDRTERKADAAEDRAEAKPKVDNR
jgi:hypothetical protein